MWLVSTVIWSAVCSVTFGLMYVVGFVVGQFILVGLARSKLGDVPRRAEDEEDVALAAFASFCKGIEAGRFSRLDDRDDLWQVLIVLTERKAVDQVRRERAQKRGAGDVRPLTGERRGVRTAPWSPPRPVRAPGRDGEAKAEYQ